MLFRFQLSVIFLTIVLIQGFSPLTFAQTETDNFIEDPRPKFFQFQFRTVTDFTLSGVSSEFGNSSALVQVNQRFRLKLEIPVLVKPKDQLALGLRLYREEFYFENVDQLDYPLYQNLQDKSLLTLGFRSTYRRKMDQGKYIIGRIGADLNGDGTGSV